MSAAGAGAGAGAGRPSRRDGVVLHIHDSRPSRGRGRGRGRGTRTKAPRAQTAAVQRRPAKQSLSEQVVLGVVEAAFGPSDPCTQMIEGRPLRFDYISRRYRVVVEADGAQHYQYTPCFHRGGPGDLLDQYGRDCSKDEWCARNGYEMLRIPTFNPICPSRTADPQVLQWAVRERIEQLLRGREEAAPPPSYELCADTPSQGAAAAPATPAKDGAPAGAGAGADASEIVGIVSSDEEL